MRIAFIGQKGIPVTQGGVERHTEELAIRMAKRGHEVRVYTRPSYTDPKLKEYKGVKLVSLPSVNTKNLDAISHTFISILHLIFHPTDAVMFQAIGPNSLNWLVRIFRPSIRVLGMFHCQDYFHEKWGRVARMTLRFGEWALSKFSHVIFVTSKILQNRVFNLYGRKAVHLPNGVPRPAKIDEKIEKETLAKFDLTPNEYLVVVTRLIAHKGVHYILEAFKNIKTDKKLVIVGGTSFTDDYVKKLQDFAKEDSRVVFTDFLTGDALQAVFRNADLFVHSSDAEGLPINVLEAMSFGMAPVLSDIPEHLETSGGHAYFHKQGNVADLRNVIEHLLKPENKQEKETVGRKAQEYVVKNHDWETLTDRVIENVVLPGQGSIVAHKKAI